MKGIKRMRLNENAYNFQFFKKRDLYVKNCEISRISVPVVR
jgi:hypothetical protein